MALEELDTEMTGDLGLRTWLSSRSSLVVIFAWSDWRRKSDCENMLEVIKALSSKPEYSRSVLFYRLNADENGQACRDLSITDAPCVVVFKNGREVIRFSRASSGDAISHHLDTLLDPARNPSAKKSPFSLSKVESHFHG